MLLVSGLGLFYLNRNLAKHYRMISLVAQQISQGDHSLRIPDLELGEFNHLGQNLNQMLGKLDDTIAHLALHREELRLVLSSIDDLIWSQDSEGRIVWANSAFASFFAGYDEKTSTNISELANDPLLTSAMDDWDSAERLRLKELHFKGHYFLLSGKRNPQAQRTVYLMQNIDSIRQAEQMKKDFVVNLAHELRTPLTAIHGFSEAMEEFVVEENQRYLRIIQNHTKRLIHLIKDLEQLIRLESTDRLELQEINLATFFDNLALVLSPMTESKGLQLKIRLAEGLPRFVCDPFKFEQIFINLVQNSLRYTDTGSIRIAATREHQSVLFRVSDTGRGIEAVHLPRIFERFYVADPSRNRERTGTGLGLAIVKHIVLLHRGNIFAESEPGKGTSFFMRFPITTV